MIPVFGAACREVEGPVGLRPIRRGGGGAPAQRKMALPDRAASSARRRRSGCKLIGWGRAVRRPNWAENSLPAFLGVGRRAARPRGFVAYRSGALTGDRRSGPARSEGRAADDKRAAESIAAGPSRPWRLRRSRDATDSVRSGERCGDRCERSRRSLRALSEVVKSALFQRGGSLRALSEVVKSALRDFVESAGGRGQRQTRNSKWVRSVLGCVA
jgi:hypothetical protein